jgi:hypothetical protein
MLWLYHGPGSTEVQLVAEKNGRYWNTLKDQAVRYLQLNGLTDAAEILATMPFELWEGTNVFGDEFEVLYLRTGMENYVKLRNDVDERWYTFREIVNALAELNRPIRFIVADAVTDETADIPTPTLATQSAVVQRALMDFETLIRANGAVSGFDRVHTALHGYLKEICREGNFTYTPDADITTLFKLVREKHPKFQGNPTSTAPSKILRGLSQVMDAMNPVRNHNSMAHPNEDLLEEPEAMLAANATKSLLHYLNMKLR